LASADERDLWSELFRIFCETGAGWLVGENVEGLLSSENGRFFGRILRDMAEMGICVGWACFPAYPTGAAFSRARVSIIACSNSHRLERDGKRFEKAFASNFVQRAPSEAVNAALSLWNRKETDNCRIRANDGVSNWMDRIKSLGNAVNPYQFYPIFKAIAEIEAELSCNSGNLAQDSL
jgi:DNA (cytosine-5)-methyltransferase 1